MIVSKFRDLVDAPGKKAFIYRWLGYKIRYFGTTVGIFGSNLIRKGRVIKIIEIDPKAFLPKKHTIDKEHRK